MKISSGQNKYRLFARKPKQGSMIGSTLTKWSTKEIFCIQETQTCCIEIIVSLSGLPYLVCICCIKHRKCDKEKAGQLFWKSFAWKSSDTQWVETFQYFIRNNRFVQPESYEPNQNIHPKIGFFHWFLTNF